MLRIVVKLRLIVLHLVFLLFRVESQTTSPDFYTSDDTNFQPSLVVVIGILGVVLVLTFLILGYAKFCPRRGPLGRNNLLQNRTGLFTASNRFSGIDKTVVESLPFFRFSSLKGSKEGLECAVCLSKFEDTEVLRLLPKCKHAFHMNCIDHWLEKHSTCPLCRHRVSSEDLKLITYSNSMRFLWNKQPEPREDSNNTELFVQREESRRGSSRFSIGRSFRKVNEEESLIQKEVREENSVEDQRAKSIFHKHNHKLIASDFVFNNRWSNLSSSDLVFLNSEMLNDMSSNRFASTDWNIDMLSTKQSAEKEGITKIKEEMELKKSFESKIGAISTSVSSPGVSSTSAGMVRTSSHASRSVTSGGEQRSASEITAFSRYGDSGVKNRIAGSSSLFESTVKEERIRRIWLPIATRTVQWFAKRERRSQLSQNSQRQPSDV